MKVRPANPTAGHRRLPQTLHQQSIDAQVISKIKENPWQHDLELINVLNVPGRDVAKDIDPKKLLDALEGNYATEKIVLKLPEIFKDPALEALKKHPLNVDQMKYSETNLRRFKKRADKKKVKVDAIDMNNHVFINAVSDLPETKQRALLLTLSKMAKSLEFGGLTTDEDATAVTSTAKSTLGLEKVQRGMGRGIMEDDISLKSQTSHSTQNQSQALASKVSSGGTSSYSTATHYGKTVSDSNEREVARVLNCIGEGMHFNPENEFKYQSIITRGSIKTIGTDLTAPTEIMAVMAREFKVKIGTSEVEALMRKFDTDNLGLASLGAILGAAKLAYSKKVQRSLMADLDVQQQEARRELEKRRAEHREKIGGRSLDGNVTEGSMKREAMKNVIEKLAQAAYVAMRGKALKSLNIARARISSKEYRDLLKELKVELLPREITMLEHRYYIPSCGSIDTAAFKSEFLALGKDIVRERMRAEALQSFLRTLATTNPNPSPELKQVPLNPGEGSATGESQAAKAADYAINASIAGNDIKPVGPSNYSIELAEEWISDPLSSPTKKTKKKAVSNNATIDGSRNVLGTSAKDAMLSQFLNMSDTIPGSDRSKEIDAENINDTNGIRHNYSDAISTADMSSLTSRSGMISNTELPLSETSLMRKKKREKFIASEEALKGNTKNVNSSISSVNSTSGGTILSIAESATKSNHGILSNGTSKVSGESSVFSAGSQHFYRPQAELDLGRDNPTSSAFEEQVGSLELPFELQLSRINMDLHDNDDDSVTSAVGSIAPSINEIDSVKSPYGARPATKEQKRAIEAQRDAQRESERMAAAAELERKREWKEMLDKQEIKNRDLKAAEAAAARIAAAERAEKQKIEDMERAESQRQIAEREALSRAAAAKAAAKAAQEKAIIEKTASAREDALKALREQAAEQAAVRQLSEKQNAERAEVSRPKTREIKPPSSPPPRPRPTPAEDNITVPDTKVMQAQPKPEVIFQEQSHSHSLAEFTPADLAANVAHRCKNFDEQQELIRRIEVSEKVDPVSLSDAYFFLAEKRLERGQVLDALASLERSYRLRTFGDPIFIARRLQQLIRLSATLDGMESKTNELATELLSITNQHYGEDGTEYGRSCYFVAEIFASMQQKTKAIKLLEISRNIFLDNLGDTHNETIAACDALLHVQGSQAEMLDIRATDDNVHHNQSPEFSSNAGAATAIEEFYLHGELWSVYETTAADGRTHPYYFSYLGGQEYSQWDDPRVSGITNEDMQVSLPYAEHYEEENNYSMDIHSIGLPHGKEDLSVLMASTSEGVWQQRRMQEEVAYALADVDILERDDDVLNASTAEQFPSPSGSQRVFSFKNAMK